MRHFYNSGRDAPTMPEVRVSTAPSIRRFGTLVSLCDMLLSTFFCKVRSSNKRDMPIYFIICNVTPAKYGKSTASKVVPVVKERAFYFSFCICATGSQFTQVAKSAILKTAKLGERMSFDPTMIPSQQGELIFVGNILLKGAINTHCGHYLRYLCKEVLPKDTPAFDIKVRHNDPAVGNSVKILAIRCGKASSTKVAEILSTALSSSAWIHCRMAMSHTNMHDMPNVGGSSEQLKLTCVSEFTRVHAIWNGFFQVDWYLLHVYMYPISAPLFFVAEWSRPRRAETRF